MGIYRVGTRGLSARLVLRPPSRDGFPCQFGSFLVAEAGERGTGFLGVAGAGCGFLGGLAATEGDGGAILHSDRG